MGENFGEERQEKRASSLKHVSEGVEDESDVKQRSTSSKKKKSSKKLLDESDNGAEKSPKKKKSTKKLLDESEKSPKKKKKNKSKRNVASEDIVFVPPGESEKNEE